MASVAGYIAALPAAQREIASKLLPLIDSVLPGTDAVWHGHPVWSLGPAPGKSPVCLIKAYPKHVTFGFWKGQDISDPSGRLTPGARQMAPSNSIPLPTSTPPSSPTGSVRPAPSKPDPRLPPNPAGALMSLRRKTLPSA